MCHFRTIEGLIGSLHYLFFNTKEEEEYLGHYNDCYDVDDTLKRATDGWVKAANDARSEGKEHLKISFRNGSLGIDSTFYDSDDDA